MNLVWRFYSSDDHRWGWQHLSMYGVVLKESESTHDTYEECLANAQSLGYVFLPAQTTQPDVPARVTKRSKSYRLLKTSKQ